jgi:hypothetical protein
MYSHKMSLWDKLPTDTIQHIYEYDLTYKEKMDESLKLIEHGQPTCCCDGGKKNRYRHYDDDYTYAFWSWEWRRRNACPMHNSDEFDKNGHQTAYNWGPQDYEIENIELFYPITFGLTNDYYNYEIRTGRVWWNGTVNYNLTILSIWVFCSIKSKEIPVKTYSRKKLSGARFMDMAHGQRPVMA